MDKHVQIQLNAKRTISGVIRGYDAFMNLVVEEAHELYGQQLQERQPIGMVVIRGNSVSSLRII
jgi:small nuclear ribonucleoprotein G